MGGGSGLQDMPWTERDGLWNTPGKCDQVSRLFPQTLADSRLTPGRRGWGDKRRGEGANAWRKRTISGQDVYGNKNLKMLMGPPKSPAEGLACSWPCGRKWGDSVFVYCGGGQGGGQIPISHFQESQVLFSGASSPGMCWCRGGVAPGRCGKSQQSIRGVWWQRNPHREPLPPPQFISPSPTWGAEHYREDFALDPSIFWRILLDLCPPISTSTWGRKRGLEEDDLSLGPKTLVMTSKFIQWTSLSTYYVPDTVREDELTEVNFGSFQDETLYWVGQKVCLDFSLTSYGKTQTFWPAQYN